MAKRGHGQAKRKGKKGRGARSLLLPAAFQLSAYAIALLCCAVLTLHSDGSRTHDFYRIIGALTLAAFCSSYAAARNRKQHGLLTGFLSTLPMHLLLLAVSLILGRFHADWTLLISFAILSIVSMLGGVLAVNRREAPQMPAAKR